MDSSSETQPGLIKLTGIVGIGASAGGLEALEELFTAMPAGTGLAFVVVQHLSPVFQSHMDELLARRTSLKIRVIEDGDQLRPDTIFLLPPRKVTKRDGNNLRLFDRPSDNVVSLPINIFFESLAEHVDPPIAAVVLSGTGSDGAIGIQAVHHVGGLVLSQSEKSAKFVGMPSKAVATQCVDLSLPPNLIAEALSIFARSANKHEVLEQLKASFGDAEYSSVFEILRDRYSLDFSQYKITTLHRRIRRRMQRIGYTDTTSYVQYLHDEPEEVTKLYQDFLIGVTQFFRDSDAFAELELRVIGPLAARAADDDEIRVWVAGCATGQEAYSVAMLLRDYLDQYEKKTHFRVFATDMHPESLRVASLGQYTAADMEMVPDTRRSRFFTKVGGSYQVCKELREHIVFATHNLISDPPFTNLDLVCCRNLLIYLDETAQESVLSYIHYGLKPNGSLFLGPSEVLGAAASAFEAIDQHSKLYTKVGAYLPAHHASISRSRPLTVRPQANIATSKRSMVDSSVLQCYDRLLDLFMPDSVLVDSELSLVQTFGDAASILKIPRGRASTSVLDLLPEALRSVVAAGLRQAGRDRTIVRIEQLAEVNASVATTFRSVTVRPMVTTSGQPNYYLIEFQTSTVTATEPPPGIALIRGLEDEWDQVKLLKHELDYTRENLQATVEELETTNEELQTTNEELTSSNEELQSSNEELHSVNEELYTVNSEYQRKIKELTELTNDIQNLLSCSDVGVMFLDRDLMIRRFTPKIGELMGLRDSKLGEPVAVCDSLLPGIDLPGLCRSVMESGRPEHLELQGVRGVSLLLQVLPYEVKKSVTGIIVTLIDITGVKKTEREIVKLSAIVSSSDFAIVSCSVDGVIETWNHAAAELYGIDERKAVGSKLTEVFPPVLSNKIMPLFHAAAADSPTTDIEIEITVPKGASRTILTHVQGIRGKHTNISAVSLIFQDVTEQKAAALSLKLRTRAIEATINGIILVDALAPDQPIIYANQGFCRMTGYALEEILGRNCRFLQGPESDANAIASIRAAVHGGSECRCNIVNYRRDGSKFHNDLTISPIKDEDGRVTHFVGVQHDVTRLVEAERVLQSEIEYRAAFENAAVGMAKVSRQGKLLRVNDKLCQILGFTRRQLLASSLPELAHPDDAQACLDQLKDAADGSLALQSIELRLRHRSGHIIWSSITVSRHHVADLDQTACIALIQDISVRKHFEQELKASIHARETFLAMLSHELRNPLSAVLNAGRLAMRRAERNGQRPDEAFAIIERQAGHISKLLRDLWTFLASVSVRLNWS